MNLLLPEEVRERSGLQQRVVGRGGRDEAARFGSACGSVGRPAHPDLRGPRASGGK